MNTFIPKLLKCLIHHILLYNLRLLRFHLFYFLIWLLFDVFQLFNYLNTWFDWMFLDHIFEHYLRIVWNFFLVSMLHPLSFSSIQHFEHYSYIRYLKIHLLVFTNFFYLYLVHLLDLKEFAIINYKK